MVSKEFEIKAIPGFIDLRYKNSKRTCYNKGILTVAVVPFNRKYHYQWSDGYNSNENDLTQREINLGVTYHLTITDEQTSCQKVFLNVSNALSLPYSPISIKSYKDATGPDKKDGEVDIWLYGNQNAIPWNAKLISTRNGTPYPDATFTFSNTYQLKIGKLLPGIYQFKIEDAKGCEVIQLVHEIYSCPVKPEAHIKIYSYSLPPSTPGAYIKANAYYSGDLSKCKYFWYIFNNPFYYKSTAQAELNSDEIKSLTWNTNDRICVRMLCPCTTSAYDCVKYNPCDNNTINFKKKELINICSGSLPTGKFVQHREHGTIDLEIDITTLQLGHEIGKPEFDYYIHDLRWDDGTSVNYFYNKTSKTFTIFRNVIESKTYTLIITDGLGCSHFANLFIGNDFRYEQSNANDQDFCFFWTACKPFEETTENEVWKHFENSIHPGLGGNCNLELWCGNQKIRNLMTTTSPYYDEREIFEDENGNCYSRKICFIEDWGDIQVDLNLEEYDMLYFNPNESDPFIRGEKRLVYIALHQVPCCDLENFSSTQLAASLYHVNYINDGPYNDIRMNSDNPCKAILYCPENSLYVKYINGNIAEEKYCKINGVT